MRRLIKIYDTTLRDGTQGEGVSFSMEDKVRLTSRLDAFGIHYIEGGWPGSNPKDLRFFRRMQDVTLKHAKLAAFSMTRRAGGATESDPNMRAILECGRAGGDDRRQVVGLPRDRGAGDHAGRERGDDPRLHRLSQAAHGRGPLRRRALLRRLPCQSRVRAGHAEGRRRGRRRLADPVRHQRRDAAARAGRDHPRGQARGAHARWASTSTTTPSARWPTRWPR